MRVVSLGFMTAFFVVLAGLAGLVGPAVASDRVALGFGRLLVNDWFGDSQDRWHTGSVALSFLRGPEGAQGLSTVPGALLEYRLSGRIVAPASLNVPAAGDRPYAGLLSFGVHSHFATGPLEVALGADLVFTGPQTGLADFQEAFHDILGFGGPSAAVLAGQIPNALYPTALVEVARPIQFGDRLRLRPFVEVQAGVENFIRVGGDVLWGARWSQGVYARDITTGLLYQTARVEAAPGVALLIGADTAHVFSSALLPAADGYVLTPTRNRARLGVHLQGKRASVFYGLTWMGREFSAQPEGQVVGAVHFGLRF